MKKLDRKQKQLLFAGLVLIVLNGIHMHYFALPDFVRGIFFGAGIGLLIWSFWLHKPAVPRK
jgi:hypothetical protein